MLKTTMPHIVLTRPQAASNRFAEALQAVRPDVSVIISPVLSITYLKNVPLPDAKALVLTSVHGLEGYLRQGGEPTLAYCVGKRTALKARERGFQIVAIEESLAKLEPVLRKIDATGLLHVHGKHVTGNLSNQIIGMQDVVVYDQPAQALTGEAQKALSGERAVVLPLFSPRSAREVARQIEPKAPVFAAFISDAAKMQFADVTLRGGLTAERPDGDAMCNATLTLLEAACALEACK
ncbi:uroporphyrinogen-III synthase [Lentibacter algarum]|uniref:uroporphyrinogen-III synthase n=1 Tax=Lentibacter algarum TaxID=576131 RepID=UPI001C067B9A|nr:uroporphyrinogen-III synthase [Lentibacter algarum]MBU2980376.1 uroporphyrinogen-III synthase [Lentibacter algarum]